MAMEKNKIIEGDSAEVLQGFDPETVDLTVTSPPYFNAREYSQYKTYEEYLETLERIFSEVYRVTKLSRMAIVNLSSVIIEREKRSASSYRIPIPFHFVPLMEKIGFQFQEDIIWKKPEGSVFARNWQFSQSRKPLVYKPNLVTEYILVFKKPAPFLIDKILKDEPIVDYKIETSNVWEINPQSRDDHPAPFPIELASRCIVYYSYKGDLVLDPFSGSGTTCQAAKELGRDYIGIEYKSNYVEASRDRLLATVPALF